MVEAAAVLDDLVQDQAVPVAREYLASEMTAVSQPVTMMQAAAVGLALLALLVLLPQMVALVVLEYQAVSLEQRLLMLVEVVGQVQQPVAPVVLAVAVLAP
jgi:hypothetical protein